MNLYEAIRNLMKYTHGKESVVDREGREAIWLGVEALKWYAEQREKRGATQTMWLPGETEE